MNDVLWVVLPIHLTAVVLAGAHQLLHYRNPASAVAWLFALFFLPLLGPLAYLLLAYAKPRAMRRRRERAAALRRSRPDEPDPASSPATLDGDGAIAAQQRLVRAVASFPMTDGNALRILTGGRDGLDEQLAAIRAAEHEVLLQTFIANDGKVFRELLDALHDRRRAGVDVQLLFDPIGSQKMSWATIRQLRASGLSCLEFQTPNPLKGRFQINFRNHRKILCIDGVRTFTGGRNWADEYYPVGDDAPFRDLTIEVRGPASTAFRRVFQEDWAIAQESETCPEDTRFRPRRCGDSKVRVIPFGPDEPRETALDVIGGAIRAAREHITIVTPYFVPGEAIVHDLRVAGLSGIRIDLLVPLDSDSNAVDRAARSYFETLFEAGVRIHRLPSPLLHAKAMVVDDAWCLCGSANFDGRSFFLNYEINVESLDPAFCRALREHFEPDFERAERVDPDTFARRGIASRMTEKAAALFEPLL